MINSIIITDYSTTKQDELKSLRYLFLSINYKCIIYSNKDNIDFSLYDIIFLYNTVNYKLISVHRPVIWLDNMKDERRLIHIISRFFLADGIVLIDDFENQSFKEVLPKFLFKKIRLFPEIHPNICLSNKENKILVDIDIEEQFARLFYNLLSILNKIQDIPIYIKTNKYYSSVMNDNIHIIQQFDDSELKSYSLIIANKTTATKAILSKISCIVLGEKGYGGIVNEDNFAHLFACNFNGRAGGYYGEQIPTSIFLNDIISVIKNPDNKTNTEKNCELMSNLKSSQLKELSTYLKALTNTYNEKATNLIFVEFIQNSYYSVYQYSKDGWIIKNFVGKLIFDICKNEHMILFEFKNPTTIENVINKPLFSTNKHHVIAFIKKLIKYKIIISCADKIG